MNIGKKFKLRDRMELGIDDEKDTLQSLIRSCLLELNSLKLELTVLEVEKANDNTPQLVFVFRWDLNFFSCFLLQTTCSLWSVSVFLVP